MSHMQFLVERSSEEDGDPCGHALMASCPPEPFPREEVPFGHHPTYLGGTAPKTWDVSKSDLANLLDLSKRLNLDGEITPVMAWGMVLAHPRFSELRNKDFKSICGNLGAKIRCYGYVFLPSTQQVSYCVKPNPFISLLSNAVRYWLLKHCVSSSIAIA